MSTNALIIGGGPAGASSAIRLKRNGFTVQLYEKASFPRPKLCGGFLSPESLEDLQELGILDELRRKGAVSVSRTVVASTRGTLIESELPADTLSISRDVMDFLLLEQARAEGVDVIVGQDGFQAPVARDVTVVATGRLSMPQGTIDQAQLTPWYADTTQRYYGIQAFFDGVQGISDQVELDLVESGYVGLVRQKEGGVNVCALTTQDAIQAWGPSLDAILGHFVEENAVLKGHLRTARRRSEWMSVGPVRMGIRQLVKEKTFFVGDAACVMDPFAGEGMAMALYGSRLLTEALVQSKVPPATRYSQTWHKAFDPALRWNALMRLFYGVPLLRDPLMQGLRVFPRGMQWLTDLTRYRPIHL